MLEKRQAFTFVWGFTLGDNIALHSCTPSTIFVSRDPQNINPQVAVPPYTIIAYPNQGLPTVDLLGNGPDNMSWTPRFPAGTSILINIVDALGNSGGIAQKLYTLGSGASTSCVPTTSDTDFRASIDGASTTLQTCQTLPIRIQGGRKPYTVTIANTNSSNAVNVTMDAANDYYQWVNRADPGQSLIAAVSDSTGQYAPSVQFFTTAGSTDKTCAGQNNIQSVYGASTSSSSSSTTTSSGSSTTTSAAPGGQDTGGSKSLTGAIIGTILALLAIFGIIAYIFFRRRNSRRAQFDGDPTTASGGGFGMKDYKRGNNMPGNESFLPLHDQDSVPRTPVFGEQTLGSPQTGFGPRRQSNMDYYTSPPTNYSGGTTNSYGTSAVGSGQSGPSQSTMSSGAAAAAAAGRPMTKREMMLEDQRRQQEFNGGYQGQPRPESMYPPGSSYTVNPFGDNAYPYNPAGNTAPTHSHARSSSFGASAVLGTASAAAGPPGTYTPPSYNPSHTGTGTGMGTPPRPSGSQDLTTMTAAAAPGRGAQAGMTPAARAKAAEAAQEQRRAYTDEDDDDILAYTQPRLMLGVTNPDRASVATTNTTASAATVDANAHAIAPGAMTPTQVYQHEDAGAVVELPPAYREFSRTPAPGSGPPRR